MSIKKTIVLLMIITLLIAGMNIVASIDYASSELTSFPWWSVIVLTGYYYGPLLLLEIGALVGVHVWQKRKQKKEAYKEGLCPSLLL